jgi:hypothetical protein
MKSGTSPKLAADHIEKASFFEAPKGLFNAMAIPFRHGFKPSVANILFSIDRAAA